MQHRGLEFDIYGLKRIGIFTHDLYPFKPWGQGRYVYDLVRHLRTGHGREVFVFSPSDNIEDDHHLQIFAGSHHRPGRNITFSIRLGRVIEKIIKKFNLSLVHFQGGPGGLFVVRRPSVPLIYTVHHTYYQQFKYIPSQRWKRILYLWEKLSYGKSDYIICDSDSTRRIINRHYAVGKRTCSIVPIGVDQRCFYPLGLKRIPNSLLFLGRLEKRKGVDFLVRSILAAKKEIDEIRLFIGGKGGLRPEMEAFVKRNGLKGNIIFLGTIDDRDLTGWYNKVSLVVIPSIFEGFGLTAIEAMACATPVIVTGVDGLRDVVKDDVNGLTVPYNDVEALSEKIVMLLRDKDRQRALVRNGRMTVEENYNWDKISQEIINIYDGILSRSGES